jgi:hypothetical protein
MPSLEDVLVQRQRDKRAAKRLLRKLLKKQLRPRRVMITDKLANYSAAKREIMPSVEHRQHKGLNSRVENSHQPTRRRERQMKQFKSAGQAQRFLSTHDQINNLFYLRRDHVTAAELRASRSQRRSTAKPQPRPPDHHPLRPWPDAYSPSSGESVSPGRRPLPAFAPHSDLFVSLELSRSTWVATSLALGSSKISKHTLVGDSPRSRTRQEAISGKPDKCDRGAP